MSLYQELKRRNVIRVATAYVVAAWLVIQVIETIFPAFGFTDRAVRIAVIVLGIGFVPAVVGAWVFELTPEGLKRDEDARVAGTSIGAKILDRAIVVFLVLGISYFAFDKFVLAPERIAEAEAGAAAQARADAVSGFYGDRSIAVLPFDNMSADPEQVYFVDGVAEEILNLLARMRDLRVISRSSSFAFRGQGLETPDIAERLGVAHVLEGSVRRAGNRVRVTAQLIEARTDTHLWSKTYEREFNDVFLIQDEIAADVVRNLEVKLSGPLPHSRKVDPEVLALVQQAKQVFEFRDVDAGERMRALLEKALELDPNYPPAIWWMGNAEFLRAGAGIISREEWAQRWQSLRDRLLELDAESAYIAFDDAWSSWETGDWEQAAEHYQRALDQDLSDSTNVRIAGLFALFVGKLDVAQRLSAHAVAIDPLCFQCLRQLSQVMMFRGDIEGALELRARYLKIGSGGQYDYSWMLILSGRPEEVADIWAKTPDDSVQKHAILAIADYASGNRDAAQLAARQLDEDFAGIGERNLSSKQIEYMQYVIASVNAQLGNADRAFELLMPPTDQTDVMMSVRLFHPTWNKIHDDPRWLEYREAIGMSQERLDAIEFDPWLPE